MSSEEVTDLDLVAVIPPGLDAQRRIPRPAEFTIAVTAGGFRLLVGSDVPDEVAGRLSSIMTETPDQCHEPADEPAALTCCREVLAARRAGWRCAGRRGSPGPQGRGGAHCGYGLAGVPRPAT